MCDENRPSVPGGRRCRGQALIEFALVLPILLALFLVMIDGASAARAHMDAQAAATEAASWWSQNPDASTAQVTAHVKEAMKGSVPDGMTITMTSLASDGKIVMMRVSGATAATKSTTEKMKFQVNVKFPTLFGAFRGDPVTGTAQASAVGRSTTEGGAS